VPRTDGLRDVVRSVAAQGTTERFGPTRVREGAGSGPGGDRPGASTPSGEGPRQHRAPDSFRKFLNDFGRMVKEVPE